LSGEVCLSKAGEVSIRFRYGFKWEGAKRWHQCGTWPAASLAQIRKERDRARQKVNDGVSPALAKKAARIEKQEAMEATIAKAKRDKTQNLTVADLFNEWIKEGVARADGNERLKGAFELNVLPATGNKPLRKVADKDLMEVLRRAKERINEGRHSKGGDGSISVLSRHIRQMLRWAEKRQPWRGLLVEGNPSDLVDTEQLLAPDYLGYSDRVLSNDEIVALRDGLEPLAGNTAAGVTIPRMRFAIWICLSTLCHIGELMQAKWEHIDLEQGTWLIPAVNTKGRRS